MRSDDQRDAKGKRAVDGRKEVPVQRVRLLTGMAIALVILTVLVMAANPGASGKNDTTLSQAMLSERSQLEIDTEGLTARVVEQNFQIHMEEMDQQTGEIPYVEIWVLNDPFYPLMGEVGDLRDEDGTLSSKEWQMLGFPDYEFEQEGSTTAPVSSTPTSTLPVTTGVQRVAMVEEIYEIRGILYVDIKVNDVTYDKLKAGSEFAEVFMVQEIVNERTVRVLCGDETYDLEVGQLRKI
ncbi:MAG: hypothetical protein JW854_13510 [Actinobacteria bacterium]|nr:hypothetical protein [Actinomycetota bacterium]